NSIKGMKLLKNFRLVCGILLVLLGVSCLAVYFCKLPSHEIARARLDELIGAKQIVKATVTPTAYAGIYEVQGEGLQKGKPQKFSITTHLDETEIKALSEQASVKFAVPGAGARGQWINIVS